MRPFYICGKGKYKFTEKEGLKGGNHKQKTEAVEVA